MPQLTSASHLYCITVRTWAICGSLYLKRREITSPPELRGKEGPFLFACSPTFKTDAIRFTAGWRPEPDTQSTGFCPPAVILEKSSSGGIGEAKELSNIWVEVMQPSDKYVYLGYINQQGLFAK